MKYSDFIAYLDDNKVDKLLACLKQAPRNKVLDALQDYYDGNQWAFNLGLNNSESRTARSGKEMWKPFSENPNHGYSEGELRVWNIIRSAIDTYAKYVRGNDKDNVKINVKRGTKIDKDLSEEAALIFDDIDLWSMDATKRMSIESVLVTKFTPFNVDDDADLVGSEEDIIKAIKMEEQLSMGGIVEAIDPREVEPIYWKGMVRGIIRFYEIEKEVAKERYGVNVKKNPYYIEVWYIADDATFQIRKYVNDTLIEDESGVSPYEFLPYRIVANEKHSKYSFDRKNLEVSDVAKLVDLQDELNAFVTDLGVIYRQVAIPMLKLTDAFVKDAKAGDMKKVEENLKALRTYAGMILFAPVEKLDGTGVPDSQVRYLQDLLEQYYKETSIPKSVFNSEGLANIAAASLEFLFQSLATVIADKRTRLANIIVDNVKMLLISKSLKVSEFTIEVVWPEMFGTTKTDRIKIITDGAINKLLPTEYASGKIIAELGDGEKTEEILAQMAEEDAAFKQKLETMGAMNTIRNSATDPQAAQIRENLNNTNRDLNGNQPSGVQPNSGSVS